MMGFPGGMELFVILLIVLILFGGKKLPELDALKMARNAIDQGAAVRRLRALLRLRVGARYDSRELQYLPGLGSGRVPARISLRCPDLSDLRRRRSGPTSCATCCRLA